MQGTPVWYLIWEGPTHHRATKPLPTTTEAHVPRARALHLEKARMQQRRPRNQLSLIKK